MKTLRLTAVLLFLVATGCAQYAWYNPKSRFRSPEGTRFEIK